MQRKFFYSSCLFDGKNFIYHNKNVLIFKNNIFEGMVPFDEIMPQEIYHTPHVLIPGFVNAHHHIELSALKSTKYTFNGINDFFKNIFQKKFGIEKELLLNEAEKEIKLLEIHGISLCGDISNLDITAELKSKSELSFHTFVEIIGYDADIIDTVFKKHVNLSNKFISKKDTASLSLHAPYTVHPRMFDKVLNHPENMVICMHYLESKAEAAWYNGDNSYIQNIFDLAGARCPDDKEFTNFYQPEKFLFKKFPKKFLLIHGTYIQHHHLKHNLSFRFCLCPRSNIIIEQKMPDAEFVKLISNDFCLGTDSLVSSPDGNVLNEANIMLKEYSFLTTEQVLKAITFNGAKALGREKEFGGFITGKKIGLNEIYIENRKINFIKKLV